jgi:CheY-like chemotaxis protein
MFFPIAPRVLLIDDDPLFGAILSRLAQAGNIVLDHVVSSRSMDMHNIRDAYDFIITDYDLGNVTGIQLIQSLEACNQALPAILVSSYGGIPHPKLPPSILFSLHKCEGPQRILYRALCAYNGIVPDRLISDCFER